MANFQLANDMVVHLPIVALDAAGVVVPAPTGDTFSVVSSNPASLNAVVGTMISTSNPAVIINALVQVSPGLTFTLSDSSGLSVDVVTVDIVVDTSPRALGVNVAGSESASQPVPTAPGP